MDTDPLVYARSHTHTKYTLSLSLSLSICQDHLAALMEVNEENETLTKQYDREKQRRKEIEEVHSQYMHIIMYILYVL